MKKLVVMGLALTMALGITACSGGNSSQTESTGPSVGTEAASSTEAGKSEETPAQADGDVETKELKVSHVFAESHPVHQAFLQASDELYDKTGGRYLCVESSYVLIESN